MGVEKSLRSTTYASAGIPLTSGVLASLRGLFSGNMGVGDVRGNVRDQVITLGSFGGTDSFKIRVLKHSARQSAETAVGIYDHVTGDDAATDTVAFVRGTNATAVAIQAALRTATGDADLTVAGDTDAGPFTITPGVVGGLGAGYDVAYQLVTLSGCSGNVTRTAVSVRIAGAAAGVVTDVGAGKSTPLGYSEKSDGTGQMADAGGGTITDRRNTALLPPTVVSAVGGNDNVTFDTTEVASGGTSAVVLWTIRKTSDDSIAVLGTEDADGDATVSSLADSTDYYVVFATQTVPGSVSRPSAPEYFTTT